METEPGKKRPMKPKVVLAVLAAVATLVALPVVASGATLGGIISSGMVVYEDNYDLSVDGYVFTSQEATEGITVGDDVYGTTVYPRTSTVYDSQGNTVLATTASDYIDAITNGGVTVSSSMFRENSSLLLTRSFDSSEGDYFWGLCTVTGTTVMPAIYDDWDVDSSGLYAVGRYTLDSGDYAFDVYDLSTYSMLQTITDSTWPYDVYAYFIEDDGVIYLRVGYWGDNDFDDEIYIYYALSGGTFVETSYTDDTTYSYDDDYNGGTYTAADGTEFTLTETSSGALTLTVNGSTYTLASGSGSDRYDSYYLIGDWIDVWTYSGDEIIYSYLGTQIAESSSYHLEDYYYNTSLVINILGSPGNYLLSTTTSVSGVESGDDDDEEEDETYSYTCALYAADGTKIKDIDADGEMYRSSTYSDTPWGTVYLVCCHDYDAGTYTYLGYDEEMSPVTVGDYQLAGVSFGLKRQNSYVYYVMDTSTGLYGAVNASGDVVIPVEYTAMYDPRYTSSSYLLVQKSDGLWYVYDASAVDSANETISSSTDSDSTDSDSSDSGSTDSDATDSGSGDADSGSEDGTADSDTTDSGGTDSGSSDADSGSEDGGTDSGTTDSGTTDSGSTEDGTADSGSTDSDATDSGSTDNGSTEDGTADSGSEDDTADSGSSDADKVTKKANTMKVKVSTKTVKAKKLKKAKKTVKAITVKKAKGKVTYKKVSGSKKLTVNKKTGKITVKKGTKKNTYKIKVKVKAAGTSKYKAKTKTVTVKIKVK